MVEEKNIPEKNYSGVAVQNNALTYEQALNNMLNARWQQKGVAHLDKIYHKVYHWIDKTKNLKRCQVYLKFPNSKKAIERFFSGEDGEAKAWRFIFDVIDRYNAGEPVSVLEQPEITFGKWIEIYQDEYLVSLKESRVNQSVNVSRLQKLKDYFGQMKLQDITHWTIKNWWDESSKSISVKTLKNNFYVLKPILDGAIKKEYITVNPCDIFKTEWFKQLFRSKLTFDNKSSRKRRPIHDLNKIFSAIWDNKELRDFALWFYYTGLRNGDIINLKRENLIKYDDFYYIDLIEEKTGKNIIIPIHNALFENGAVAEGEYLYEYSCSREFAVDRIDELFRNIRAKKNIADEITFYCFRHTFRNTLERLNVSARIIDFLTGKDAAGSKKAYTHRDLLELKEAIDLLPSINEMLIKGVEKLKVSAQFPHQAKTAGSESMLKTAVYV